MDFDEVIGTMENMAELYDITAARLIDAENMELTLRAVKNSCAERMKDGDKTAEEVYNVVKYCLDRLNGGAYGGGDN